MAASIPFQIFDGGTLRKLNLESVLLPSTVESDCSWFDVALHVSR